MTRHVGMAVLVALLIGCASPIQWVGNGNLAADDWECTRDARLAAGPVYGGAAAGAVVGLTARRLYKQCMTAKGWQAMD